MLRALIWIVIVGGTAFLALPFILASLALDRQAIELPGRIYAKQETVTSHYADWTRTAEVTIEYTPSDTGSVTFFNVRMDPARYDSFRVGQPVKLRYLPIAETPDFPLAKMWRELHALPMARLSEDHAFAGLDALLTRKLPLFVRVLGGVALLLLLWRLLGLRGFGWALGITVLCAFAGLFIYQYPRPTPAPSREIRTGAGRVKSIALVDHLYEGNRSYGFTAAQPFNIVGVEFVPADRTEKVVAVDLVDAGSIPGLKRNAVVPIAYEYRSPRVSRIQGGTREFASRNLKGIVWQCTAGIVILIVFGAIFLFGSRLLARITRT